MTDRSANTEMRVRKSEESGKKRRKRGDDVHLQPRSKKKIKMKRSLKRCVVFILAQPYITFRHLTLLT